MKTMKTIVTGAVLGVAVSAMMYPQLDRKKQRSIKKMGRKAANMAEDAYDAIMEYIK
ncbi:YtxH domain-containing protein [Clostridium isatidis]|uniref:YtxH domain-containing protein n=1 Tax=Clostridium isatidis TaxID=182773 RepID=UPI000E7064A1|nr:YtxH domain-containing protein [Clostridium isatidis]NLZ35406.1 YtxH domain-containing protein [Clostridiales bacterium]